MEFAIVDAHLHVWDPHLLRYPWLDNVPFLNKPYLLKDYNAACGPVEVEALVFVQAEVDRTQLHKEVQWVTKLAREEDERLRGIVAWAPLEKGEAARTDLEQLAHNPLVKGVRRIVQAEPDPAFCLRSGFLQGVRALPDYGLHFEIAVRHTQLANATRMVEQCPEVRFVLNHIGTPDIKNQVFEPWKSDLRSLSRLDNVWCKVSGLATAADRERWTEADLKPYINHVIACFGFDRVIYGSDWPVARQATEYPRWVATLERAVSGCSDEDLLKLFRDNAIAFYRLR
jgi:L-fuconolactonase